MANSIFKLIYFVELVLISAVRTSATVKYRRLSTAEDHTTRQDLILLFINGLGMIIPLLFVFSSSLDFFNYTLPDWTGWIGAVLFAAAAALLWKTHQDLGRNWTPSLGFRQDHSLVTKGIFKTIRHPMYAAHLLWAIAQPLLLHNWIAGFSFLAAFLPQYLLRVNDEEKMMLNKFGAEYREYIKRTGRLVPLIWK